VTRRAYMTNEVFAAVREATGLSIPQLAAHLGLTPKSVYRYEHGQQPVPRFISLAMKHLAHMREIGRLDGDRLAA